MLLARWVAENMPRAEFAEIALHMGFFVDPDPFNQRLSSSSPKSTGRGRPILPLGQSGTGPLRGQACFPPTLSTRMQ
jgi:hypothetical protein